MEKVLLIGCGHMGNALLSSWVKSNKYYITVIDPLAFKSLELKYKNKKKKIKFSDSIAKLNKILDYDFIVIATKPADLKLVLEQLGNTIIKKNAVIISIIAGKKLKELESKFSNTNNFFRVMPNIPASVGESMNCVCASKKASIIKKNKVMKLLSYSGKTIFLKDENHIDMSTAISGSGPGFVFNIIDAMENSAIKLGFTKKTAKLITLQTFKGSIKLLSKNKVNAKDLVKTVATKGGTTEAGLKVMNENNFHKIFVSVTKASYKQAKKQGK